MPRRWVLLSRRVTTFEGSRAGARVDAPEGDENDAEPNRRAKPPCRLGANILHACLMNRRRHRPPSAGAPSLTLQPRATSVASSPRETGLAANSWIPNREGRRGSKGAMGSTRSQWRSRRRESRSTWRRGRGQLGRGTSDRRKTRLAGGRSLEGEGRSL